MGVPTPNGHVPQLPTQRQRAEWALDCAFAEHKGIAPTPGLLRFVAPDWVVEELVAHVMIQNLHLEALRRVSEALGHPLKGLAGKTVLDLADLAVAAIKKEGA
jgi:hypothetical protein